MILSDTEIKRALREKRIIIDPPPSLDDPKAFDTTAVDLHLGNVLRIPNKQERQVMPLDPASGDIRHALAKLYEEKEIDGVFELAPGDFVLGMTEEKVELPLIPDAVDGTFLAARVEGKSSLARSGLIVHLTAPTIHAGFPGKIALEIANLGNGSVILRPGMRFCQLIFEKVAGAPEAAISHFGHQVDPAGT